MSLSTDQFIERLSGGRETRGVEFKAAGPRGDPLVFAFVARAVLAMSNLQLGGWVLLGIFSYRSGQLVFDSAVFQSHARGLDRAPAHLQEIKKKAAMAIAQNIAKMRSPELARAIAATLAVRTRRLRRR